MNHSNLAGKTLALIVTFQENGKEDSVVVIDGEVVDVEGNLTLDYKQGKTQFPLLEEWLSRIEPTPVALRDILEQADFFLRLTGGPFPQELAITGLIPTGLKIEEVKN